MPQKAEEPHGKERRRRGTDGCATRGWLQRVGATLLCAAKQEGRRTGWSKWVDGEERGRTGGRSSRWFCSRKSYRGTTRIVLKFSVCPPRTSRIVEVFSLPTADVGLFGSSFSERSVGSPSSSHSTDRQSFFACTLRLILFRFGCLDTTAVLCCAGCDHTFPSVQTNYCCTTAVVVYCCNK